MLRWSINLFRVFGIQLAVHFSFLLLLAYFGWDGWKHGGITGALWELLLVVLFFSCVVLHELGHSLTARRYGVQVPRILLMPIGGMAEFDRIPRRPAAELLITIAGPAVNFVIAAALLPWVWQDIWSDIAVPNYGHQRMLIELTIANAVMGTFNLLPVFPMDGGRIFRALLAMRLEYLRATYWAALVGKILAATFALVAAFYLEQPVLAALFIFIFFAGSMEYRHLRQRELEAAYWADWAKRTAAAPSPSETEPPLPPILHGPN